MDKRKKKKKKAIISKWFLIRERYSIIHSALTAIDVEKAPNPERFSSLIKKLTQPHETEISCMNFIFYSILEGELKWLTEYEDSDGYILGELAAEGVKKQRKSIDDLKKSADECSLFPADNPSLDLDEIIAAPYDPEKAKELDAWAGEIVKHMERANRPGPRALEGDGNLNPNFD